MLIEKPEILESFAKHHDAYKKMSVVRKPELPEFLHSILLSQFLEIHPFL